ncbi:MAG TPA: efflux RND transporter permease subunit, partial [Geminicoccaceae bacterium]|nr:efflux RND transporter permease subunit [Geminicoccaceae bacterium]
MFLSDLFIKRPVLAGVASSLVIVIGLVSLLGLPVREFPDVDTAVVTVTTTYQGAAPEIIDTEITEVIEGAVAQVEGVRRIESSSREGRGRTVVEFEASRTIDDAAADLREVVSRVASQLPDEADRPVVVKADSDAEPVMRLSILSDRLSPADLTDLAERVVVDRLSTVDGVGEVQINGERRYAIRIWLDRSAMAARNLTVEDVEGALRRNNLELPSGSLDSTSRQLTVRTDSRLSRIEDFRGLTVAQVGGYPIRLGEIALVERGVEDDSTVVRVNGQNAIGLGVIRQAKANTIAVSDGIRAQLEAIRPLLPEGVRVEVSTDDATFIRASIEEVVKALLLAVGLVVLVIFAFLYSARATLVPAVVIPVAVIGTFAMLAALGFSINVLTLLALILAIGLVVDDAIVVLENVQRRVDGGEPPLVAAYLGTRQVTFAVLATSAVLIAVFVPISMIGGDIGRLFAEFGLALAAAVVISTFVALSLAPMLCSRLLVRTGAGRGLGARAAALAERGLGALAAGYRAVLRRALDMPLVVIAVAALVSVAGVQLYALLPNELAPTEDRGGFFVPGTAPPGATVEFTDAGALRVEEALRPLLEGGEAFRIVSVAGSWNRPNRAFVVVGLTDWDERGRSQQEIVEAVRPALAAIPDLRAFPINRSGLGQRGNSQAVEFVIGGPDYESVQRWSEAIIARAEQNP